MSTMEFRVLGPPQAIAAGGAAIPLSKQQRRLLAVLLVSANNPVSTDRLLDTLWSAPPASARTSLHAHVSRLRRALGLGANGDGALPAIDTNPSGYQLRVAPEQVDARRFERLVRQAGTELTADPATAAERLDAALELWHGSAYAEFADEAFAEAEAGRLDELRLAATEHRAEAKLRLGEHTEVVAELERFVAEHPLAERACGHLMLALYRCGRQAGALDVYRDLRARLADELGLEPSAELRRLEGDILRQNPALDYPSPGARGLRHAVRGTVPLPVTSFVGRTRDVAAVIGALSAARLLTLTGVGGVGKTRLATAVAAAVAEQYPDGAWFCELAPVTSDAAVGDAVGTALGVKQQPGASIEDSLLASLRTRRMLLILDNCEHVIDAAGRLAQDVAATCPDVTVLATSRQRLAVAGEQRWPIEPLAVRRDEDGEASAVRLFRDRATSIDPTFGDVDSTVVTELCARLDGVPLAIELAAARVAALGPAELTRRLDDRFRLLTSGPRTARRHRTLAAVVDWSYNLLAERERTVFDRLSVFTGSFTMDAAEQVCAGDDVDRADVAAIVSELVDASLVERERTGRLPRLHLLETLRQYGANRLDIRGDSDAVRLRFVDYYVELAEAAEPHIRGADEGYWVATLDRELDNFRAAHRYSLTSAASDRALRLPAALTYYALFRLRDEIISWAEAALQAPSAERHPLFARVHAVAAGGEGNRGDLALARELNERGAAARHPGTDDLPADIRLLENDTVFALYEGRAGDCYAHAEQVQALSVPAREHFHTAFALLHQVLARTYAGDHADAEALLARVAEEAATTHNPTQQAWAAYAHGEILSGQNDPAAIEHFDEAVALARTVGNAFTANVARVSVSTLLSRRGSPQEALRSFRRVIEHWHLVGDWTHQWTTLRNLIQLFTRLECYEAAATLHGAVTGARSGAVAFGSDHERLADAAAELTERLGARQFHTATNRGNALTGDEVVHYVFDRIDAALTDPPRHMGTAGTPDRARP